MFFRDHRAVAALSPLQAVRFCHSPVSVVRFQRDASGHTVSRLSLVDAESRARLAVRSFHVTLGVRKNIIKISKSTRRNTHTGDPTLIMKPTPVSDQIWHEMADLYFEAILEEVQELQSNGSGITVEYTVRLSSHSFYLSLPLGSIISFPLSFSRMIILSLLL